MKARGVLYILFILTSISPEALFSQDIYTGVDYSVGSMYYTRVSDNVKTGHYLLNRGELVVEFSPFLSHFLICSGIEFQLNKFGNSLSFPLTMRLSVGRKVRPFIEGGAFYIYSLHDNKDQFVLKNDLGVKFGIGLTYQLNKKWWIDAGYFGRFGFRSGLEEEITLPLEQLMIERYELTESCLTIGVKYRF